MDLDPRKPIDIDVPWQLELLLRTIAKETGLSVDQVVECALVLGIAKSFKE